MSLILFYDTETTGLPLFKELSDDPRQPHIVQLAAQLVDSDTRQTVASIDLTIRPDGWTIPEDVASIHGITTEQASARGIDERTALLVLLKLWQVSECRVGHNQAFDARIVRIAIKRYMPEVADAWSDGPCGCTAIESTPILALPPTERMRQTGRLHNKTPNLSEAYEFFAGRKFDGAHNASADVEACKTVYFALKDKALQSLSLIHI